MDPIARADRGARRILPRLRSGGCIRWPTAPFRTRCVPISGPLVPSPIFLQPSPKRGQPLFASSAASTTRLQGWSAGSAWPAGSAFYFPRATIRNPTSLKKKSSASSVSDRANGRRSLHARKPRPWDIRVTPRATLRLAARPAPSEPDVRVSPHKDQPSASPYGVDRRDRPGRHQRWTRTRVVSPVAGSRRTTMLVLPPCSRSGSKTVSQAAHRPRLGTLENRAILH